MRTIIYKFKVKENLEHEFIDAWKELTELIYVFEGSLGSRLHKSNDNIYIAYAQWPDKFTFDNAGSKLPKSADQIRQKMRNSCERVEKLFELEVIEDLLK